MNFEMIEEQIIKIILEEALYIHKTIGPWYVGKCL
jgi:hypothetical protein